MIDMKSCSLDAGIQPNYHIQVGLRAASKPRQEKKYTSYCGLATSILIGALKAAHGVSDVLGAPIKFDAENELERIKCKRAVRVHTYRDRYLGSTKVLGSIPCA